MFPDACGANPTVRAAPSRVPLSVYWHQGKRSPSSWTFGRRSRGRADPRRIPGAMIVELSEVDRKLTLVPRDREIVLYCT